MSPPTRIKELRSAAGLTTADLGQMIDMAQSGVSRVENGKVPVTLDTLYRIADALQVKPSELLEADATRPPRYAAADDDDLDMWKKFHKWLGEQLKI